MMAKVGDPEPANFIEVPGPVVNGRAHAGPGREGDCRLIRAVAGETAHTGLLRARVEHYRGRDVTVETV